MGRIKRYRTALSRHHRSKGHGIHSPSAYNFVRFVLREKSPYYIYSDMDETRQGVIDALRDVKKHPRVISFKGLKMLFRITNYFNPQCIMQVGTCYGLTASCILNVSSQSRLWLYEPHIDAFPVIGNVLSSYLDSIECYNSLNVAFDDYAQVVSDDAAPFVLVNSVPESSDFELLKQRLSSMLLGDCVFVFRNIHRSNSVKRLWHHLKQSMTHGQSFTNEKTGVIVARRSLNLEHFFLWF